MKQGNRTSLSDTPFKENINDFGTEPYVKGLIKFIENSSAPITIALQGEWGSGKTSMMTRLERGLCSGENAPFIGVNINTWEYSMMCSPEMTVYKILAQLVRELTGGNVDSKKKVSKIIRGLYRGGREALKLIPYAGLVMEAANVPTDLPVDDQEVSLADLREELQKAVQNLMTQKGKRGVIVFVDDLDRLNPPVAVEILELLKNVFTLGHCIFVLAIDYDVVVKGLEPKFGKLTDKNEREFRSFFDKIIQVPFSLPVSSYKPMEFVLDSLVNIGYIDYNDRYDAVFASDLQSIVEASVGKNPRSIKRLINTLSLLDCIARCEKAPDDEAKDKQEEKLLNLIIVAMQICYPKIYRMLVHKPDFLSWDVNFAHKEGIMMKSDNEQGLEWENVLEAASESDPYLTQHFADVKLLLDMILEVNGNDNSESLGINLKRILDKSSVTGVNSGEKAEDFDSRDLIQKLHTNVLRRIKELRPDIVKIQPKKNTGNGGFYFWIDSDTRFDVKFSPVVNKKNEITLRMDMNFQLSRPERMKGLSFDEIMQDIKLRASLTSLDSVITSLLSSVGYFNGRTYSDHTTYFPSLLDELRYIHGKGWMSGDITNNPNYWIDLKMPSHFESKEVVDTIAKALIANYDFRKSIKDWK